MSDTPAFFASSSARLYSAAAASHPTGNLLISPVSIIYAALLAFLGSKGQTRLNFDQSLQLSKHFKTDDALRKSFATALDDLKLSSKTPNKDATDLQLNFANGLFLQQNYTFHKSYLNDADRILRAKTQNVNFMKSEEARGSINRWVSNRTNGLIPDLVAAGSIDGNTRMVIANALYFKGQWIEKFDKSVTKPAAFTYLNGTKKMTPFMSKNLNINYVESEKLGVQYVELPYQGGASFFIVLPREVNGLRKLEAKLDAAALASLHENVAERDVQVKMPRMKLSFTTDLVELLQRLGVDKAFGPEADFSGLTPTGALYISNGFHKTFIDVNEEGTEAASASSMAFMLKMIPPPPVPFNADRPFMYGIRHDASNVILFLGRYEEIPTDA